MPDSWKGGLPITYHVGPSVAKVRLALKFNWDIKTLYNVIAKMKGEKYPDEWVIRGNHHDGWVNGASDPISGMVAEMEEARIIGELSKKGFKPQRTLVFCAWDGEEPSLLGSTEWVEDHAVELKQKAVAYLNSDGNSRGYVGFGGSHALELFFNEVARDVKDPETGVSVADRRYAKMLVDADRGSLSKIIGQKNFKIEALGSGSDFSPFFQHLGIPSANIGYGGEGDGGEYHSIYDSYDHFIRFKDPGFQYGSALAKTAGRSMLRLSNADVLPFDYATLVNTIAGYVAELKTGLDQMRAETNAENKLIKEGFFDLAKDPQHTLANPQIKESVPFLDFSKLDNAMTQLEATSTVLTTLLGQSLALDPIKMQLLNDVLFHAEQQLLDENGLPRRPWYKHMIYAPGLYTGYGVKTIPGVREGIEQRNWKEAQGYIEVVAASILNLNQALQKGVAVFK